MIEALLRRYPLISDQVTIDELRVILQQLETVLSRSIPGSILEMGCYIGTTSLFISRLLTALNSEKDFHVYDSFEGLPEKTKSDFSPAGEQFKPGELAASKKQLIANFKKANLKLPIIHKDWFEDLTLSDIPEKIAFAFLDGDYYSSIKHCLKIIETRLSKGSIVIVDDYMNVALPGARKAVDEWLHNKNHNLISAHSLAVIAIDWY